jgi:ribosomal protein S18 acetylase RimI-like enzyme
MELEVQARPAPEDVQLVLSGLAEFNERDVGPANRCALTVFLKIEAVVQAGLVGYTAWNSLHIEKIWVSDHLRGQGIASRLLREAELEAGKRGCGLSWLDTLNPNAARLYEKLGYKLFGEIPEFIKGRSRRFYLKYLPSLD